MEQKFILLEAALNTVLNMNLPNRVRLQELAKIEEYAKGLLYLPTDKAQRLGALLEAFKAELNTEAVSEECIGGYYRILKEMLSIKRSLKGPKCVIFGNNWLAEEIEKKMYAGNYCAFNWQLVNPEYINEYDLYILCDEPLKAYNLSVITDSKKILKMWDYLKYKFIVFPSFYRTYREFQRAEAGKVKCIITGNSDVADAARSSLLHVSSVSMANRAQDIYYDFQMFCHAYEAMPNIEYAIIGLAPYSLRYDTSKSKVEWRRCLVYYPIVESMHNCEDREQLIELFESEDKKIKQFFDEDYMQSLYDLYDRQSEEDRDSGETVYEEETQAQDMNIREISELYHRPQMDVFLENKVLLEQYAHFCQRKNIKVIFFIPPYTKWYKDHMNRAYYEELLATVKMLCTKYDAELVDMMDVSVPDCCFADYAGINNIGAVKVASYLNAILEK